MAASSTTTTASSTSSTTSAATTSSSSSSSTTSNNVVIIIICSVLGFFGLVIIASVAALLVRRRRNPPQSPSLLPTTKTMAHMRSISTSKSIPSIYLPVAQNEQQSPPTHFSAAAGTPPPPSRPAPLPPSRTVSSSTTSTYDTARTAEDSDTTDLAGFTIITPPPQTRSTSPSPASSPRPALPPLHQSYRPAHARSRSSSNLQVYIPHTVSSRRLSATNVTLIPLHVQGGPGSGLASVHGSVHRAGSNSDMGYSDNGDEEALGPLPAEPRSRSSTISRMSLGGPRSRSSTVSTVRYYAMEETSENAPLVGSAERSGRISFGPVSPK